MSNPLAPLFLLDYAARNLVGGRAELAPALLANAALPPELRELIQAHEKGPALAQDQHAAASSQGEADSRRETLLQKINRMSVTERINAALMGNQEERAVLVRDSNKIVTRAVLQSPKLTDQEIESVSMMKNVSEAVLRLVATNRRFIRSYAVVRNLVNNPRVPIDVVLPFVNRLNDRDLKELSRNKNVAEALRSTAFKLLKQKEAAKKP